jgi:hypothetical protein
MMAAKADVESRTAIRTAAKHLFMAGHFKAFSDQHSAISSQQSVSKYLVLSI